MMNLNDARSILLREEGIVLLPYRCSNGFLTIGIGRNLDKKGLSEAESFYLFGERGISKAEAIAILEKRGISEREAFYLLDNDIAEALEGAERFAWFYLLSANRQAVLVCMVFQLGLSGVKKFKKMIYALEVGDYELAAKEMLDSKWAKEDSPDRAKRMAKLMREG